MSQHLPAHHVPLELEPSRGRRQATYYAAGNFGRGDLFMRSSVPTTDARQALDEVPPITFRACVMRYNKDGTDEVLYRWRKGAWHLVVKKPFKRPPGRKPRN